LAAKPDDFESDIHKAASEGKLSSVKYLIEQSHISSETKNEYGYTPLISASQFGHLDVVKYLVEQCHAEITKIWGGYDEIKRYLESKKR
jgi:ankyrin repeat protein